MPKKVAGKGRYIRVGIFQLDEVLPYVFTKEIRHQLRKSGVSYKSKEWKAVSKRSYPAVIDGEIKRVMVSMGSHRYQLFAKKGIKCVTCGIKGLFFALERGRGDNPNKYHFNLYGKSRSGREIMITKDHILPRSKGGRNRLTNYQPMCYRCNQKKSNKVPDVKSTT